MIQVRAVKGVHGNRGGVVGGRGSGFRPGADERFARRERSRREERGWWGGVDVDDNMPLQALLCTLSAHCLQITSADPPLPAVTVTIGRRSSPCAKVQETIAPFSAAFFFEMASRRSRMTAR